MLYALTALLSIVVLAVVAFKLVQLFTRAPARQELLENGIVLLADGVEFLGRFWRRRKMSYGDIESAAVEPWFKALFPSFGPNVLVARTRFSSKVVVIKVREESIVREILP